MLNPLSGRRKLTLLFGKTDTKLRRALKSVNQPRCSCSNTIFFDLVLKTKYISGLNSREAASPITRSHVVRSIPNCLSRDLRTRGAWAVKRYSWNEPEGISGLIKCMLDLTEGLCSAYLLKPHFRVWSSFSFVKSSL